MRLLEQTLRSEWRGSNRVSMRSMVAAKTTFGLLLGQLKGEGVEVYVRRYLSAGYLPVCEVSDIVLITFTLAVYQSDPLLDPELAWKQVWNM